MMLSDEFRVHKLDMSLLLNCQCKATDMWFEDIEQLRHGKSNKERM